MDQMCKAVRAYLQEPGDTNLESAAVLLAETAKRDVRRFHPSTIESGLGPGTIIIPHGGPDAGKRLEAPAATTPERNTLARLAWGDREVWAHFLVEFAGIKDDMKDAWWRPFSPFKEGLIVLDVVDKENKTSHWKGEIGRVLGCTTGKAMIVAGPSFIGRAAFSVESIKVKEGNFLITWLRVYTPVE